MSAHWQLNSLVAMNFYEVVITAILIHKWKQNRNTRRCWVHPLLSERLNKGQFYTLHGRLIKFPRKFFNYYRMSHHTFKILLEKLSPGLQRRDTNLRLCIPPEERLSVTLR